MARILVVTVAHPPEDARIRHREIAAMVEFGHEVTYAAPFRAFGATQPEGLRCIDLPRSSGALVRRLPAVVAAARLMVRERGSQDLVLIHDPELLPALALLRCIPHHPVTVWDVHEDVPAQVGMLALPTPVKAVASRVLALVEAVAERSFHLLLAETAYQQRFRRRHPVVPNSVRVPPGGPWPAEDHPRVVYLGALTRARGSDELIALAQRLPEVEVEVLGNAKADVEEGLRAAAARLANLTYRGFVPNNEALARLPGALAGLSLLHDEANYAHSEPTKIMEYMAHGVPSITTPNEASRELVERTESGVVVGFGDVEAVARVIRNWDRDRAARDVIAGRAYAAASGRDWNVDGARFARILQEWVEAARE